jgi:hypothetical protein
MRAENSHLLGKMGKISTPVKPRITISSIEGMDSPSTKKSCIIEEGAPDDTNGKKRGVRVSMLDTSHTSPDAANMMAALMGKDRRKSSINVASANMEFQEKIKNAASRLFMKKKIMVFFVNSLNPSWMRMDTTLIR